MQLPYQRHRHRSETWAVTGGEGEFGLHVLLNTHSPYFLHAVEVYAAKHGVGNRCRYYAMRRNEGGCYAEDVTDSIEAIYRDMA